MQPGVMQTIVRAVAITLTACAAIRVASWLVAPVLPSLGLLLLVLVAAYLILGGRAARDRR